MVHFTLDEISTQEFSVRGGVYFIKGESDIPAVFETQIEIIPYMKFRPPPQYLTINSKV